MFHNRIAATFAASLVLALVLAGGAFAVEQGSPVTPMASAPLAESVPLAGDHSLDSLPAMYLSPFVVGCWSSSPTQRYAVGRGGISDGGGNPVIGALVQVNFQIDCLKKGADSGSAYTELVLGEDGTLHAVFTAKGSKTFRPPKAGCVIHGEVVGVTHPDFVWDPEGGDSTSSDTLCK